MAISIEYRGWEFEFDEVPSSDEIEERYRQRVERTEVDLPVPRPTPLRRNAERYSAHPLGSRTLLFRTDEPDEASSAFVESLVAGGAGVGVTDHVEVDAKSQMEGETFDARSPERGVEEWDGLVYDATGVEESKELDEVYAFFRDRLTELSDCGRVVVLGRPPETADRRSLAAVRQGLDGLVRSIAKEIGSTGATANRLVVDPDANDWAGGALQFLTSDRSSYVTAQSLRIGAPDSAVQSHAGAEGRFEGETVVVTGGTRGIGRATVSRFVDEGAEVFGIGRPGSDALESVAEHGAEPVALDVSDEEAPARIAEIADAHGGIDVLVHNAGITRDDMLVRLDDEAWREVVDVNLEGPIRITERLLEEEGLGEEASVVAVSSVTGIAGNVGQTNYAVSKAGMLGFVDRLSDRLAGTNASANAIAPGFIRTRLTDAAAGSMREAGQRMNALGQPGKPLDVANAIVFLATVGARGIDGELLRVCGGFLVGA